MKVSKNFYLSEFIHPSFFEIKGVNPIWFIDPRVFSMAQALRDRFNKPVIINDWTSKGNYSLSGLRPFSSRVGAPLSQHKYGRAIDPKVIGIDALDVQLDILGNWQYYQEAGLTTIEDSTPTWTHMDCRNTGSDSLFIIQTKYSKQS